MDTRTSLLNSAERAVRERGYQGFSYADLSREIGIRKASIHYHFPSKADLGVALAERYNHTFFGLLSEITETKITAGDQLHAYLHLYRNALKNGEQVCLCVALSAGRAHLSSEILAQLDTFHRHSLAWLEQIFETAENDGSILHLTNAKSEASAALALVEGAQLLARARKDIRLFDQAIAAMLSRLTLTIET